MSGVLKREFECQIDGTVLVAFHTAIARTTTKDCGTKKATIDEAMGERADENNVIDGKAIERECQCRIDQ